MKYLFRLLRQDLYRCICSSRFLFSALGICLTNFLSVWWDLNSSNISIAYLYMVSRVMGIANVFLLMAAIPGTALYRIDMETSFYRSACSRSPHKSYFLSKTIATFVSSIGTVLMGDGMFFAALSIRFPVLDDSFAQQMISNGMSSNGVFYLIFFLLIRSLCAAMFALMALLVSVYVTNIFLVLSTPIAAYYVWTQVSNLCRLPACVDIRHLLQGTAISGLPSNNLLYSVTFFVLFSAVFGFEFCTKARKGVTNG